MPTKILVVDDSATMRKILEMTFAGEDAEVVTVADGQSALGRSGQMVPDVVFADVSMAEMDGYAVSHAVKSNPALAKTAVIALASQHNPYDEAKGRASGVDAHVSKPFDTQALIDLTAQVLRAPRAVAEGAPPAASARAIPRAVTQTTNVAPPPPPGGGAARPAAPPASSDAARSLRRTAAFGEPPPLRPPAQKPVLELADEPEIDIEAPEAPPRPAPPAPGIPRAAAPAQKPAPAAAAPAAPKPVIPTASKPAAPAPAEPAPAAPAASAPIAERPGASAVAAATGGLEQKLAGLDLSRDQIAAVISLSREVIEQVVWEVVPDLAETLIKEEIARLTRE